MNLKSTATYFVELKGCTMRSWCEMHCEGRAMSGVNKGEPWHPTLQTTQNTPKVSITYAKAALISPSSQAYVSFRFTGSDWKCASPYSNMWWARNINLYVRVFWNLTTQYRSGFSACLSFRQLMIMSCRAYSRTAGNCSFGESPDVVQAAVMRK